MNNAKNFKKVWMNSLSFLDDSMIQSVISIVLVLYCSTIFDNINSFIGNLYNYSFVKLIILLLIVYVSPKDTTIAVLLGVSYVISLSYAVNNEYFNGNSSESENESENEYFFPLDQNTLEQNTLEQNTSEEVPVMNNEQYMNSSEMIENEQNNEQYENSDEDVNYEEKCMQNYTPMYEAVGDVCSPTETFKKELNAQGLNYPEGFNHGVYGSPLN